jgi:hypothetical protein
MELVSMLTQTLGVNDSQAKGGAGLLFGLAKEKLGGDFGQVEHRRAGDWAGPWVVWPRRSEAARENWGDWRALRGGFRVSAWTPGWWASSSP